MIHTLESTGSVEKIIDTANLLSGIVFSIETWNDMKTNVLFITARFRTGSTLLWNFFNQIPEVTAYWEPLHEQLPTYILKNIQPQKRHYHVKSYYGAYPPLSELSKWHRTAFGVNRLYLEANDDFQELYDYIRFLIQTSTNPHTVFQFNRIDFRLPWIKHHFPEVPILHLYRSSREQWLSMIRDDPSYQGDHLDIDPYRLTTWAVDLCLKFPFLASPFIRHPYQRHYYLWKLSYLAGNRLSDLSISYESILQSPRDCLTEILGMCRLAEERWIDLCKKIIVPNSLDRWQTYHDTQWFQALEDECDLVLKDFGLLECFGTQPLHKIIAAHPAYRESIKDSRTIQWAVNHGQIMSIALLDELLDKESTIQNITAEADKRDRLLNQQVSGLQELITQLHDKEHQWRLLLSVNDNRLKLIHKLETDLKLSLKENQLATVLREFHSAYQDQANTIHILYKTIEANYQSLERYIRSLYDVQHDISSKLSIAISEILKYNNNERTSNDLVIEDARFKEIILEKQILEKEIEILRMICDKRLQVIQELDQALTRYRNRFWIERLKHSLAPRLGSFFHHAPRPLSIPNRYSRLPKLSEYPVISIVTPSFNQCAFLETTILSVLDQNYPRLEYVIKDGNSADNSVAIIEKYSTRLHYTESTPDSGQANAINIGFRNTTGEIMAWLNSDDLLLPGTLHYVAHYFSLHPNVDAVYGHRILIDDFGREIGRWVLPPHDSDIVQWADYIPQETLFWRRSLWDEIGGSLDESFHFALDWDMLLRFEACGANIVRLPRFLGAFRIHPHQKTTASIAESGQKEMERLRLRCHKRPVTDVEINKHIRFYIKKHIIYQKLYEWKILRY